MTLIVYPTTKTQTVTDYIKIHK